MGHGLKLKYKKQGEKAMQTSDLIQIAVAVLASSGFWTLLNNRKEKKSASNQMLLGLGHDRIVDLGMKYIERGSITQDEFENLHDYLYLPYRDMGGNGSAKRIMDEVSKLPYKRNQ